MAKPLSSNSHRAAEIITLKAKYTEGEQKCTATVEIALVKVVLSTPRFGTPGRPKDTSDSGTSVFLVNPPAGGAAAKWKLTNASGRVCNDYIPGYNGTEQAPEHRKAVSSMGSGNPTDYAFTVNVRVTLTSPEKRKDAHNLIEVGFVQGLKISGSATYSTTPPGGKRTIKVPVEDAKKTLDWLITPCHSSDAGIEFPYFPGGPTTKTHASGEGDDVDPHVDLSMIDSPQITIPAQLDPNHGKNDAILSATALDEFLLRVSACSTDSHMLSEDFNRYWMQGAALDHEFRVSG